LSRGSDENRAKKGKWMVEGVVFRRGDSREEIYGGGWSSD